MQIWPLVLLHVLLLSAVAVDGKSNSNFRMEKVNFVWAKAAARLEDPGVVKRLQKDLVTFDNLYFSMKQDAEKPVVKSLNEVDAKLEKLLRRYELEDVVHAFEEKYKHDKNRFHHPTTSDEPKVNLKDERVAEFWKDVEGDPAFSADELEEIRGRLVELDAQSREYSELLRRHKQLDDNHVRPHEEHTNSTADMKRLNREAENKFEELRRRTAEIRGSPFTDPRVRQLWDQAQKSLGLISNELDVIKTELRHLDRELQKVDFHAKHVEEHNEIVKSMGDLDEYSVQIQERHEKMLRKLKKLESYLADKLVRHSEL